MSLYIMIKPASSACNLKCDYCFYTSLSENREKSDKGFMSETTAKNIIKSALKYDSDYINFIFQGGEPMLIGLDFYRTFISIVDELNKRDTPVDYCLQTNGTLLDDEWCNFLLENEFFLGVSLDGNEELNSYRHYADGTNAFADTMRGIELLKQYEIPFNILSVLTKRTANNFRKTYRFFKENDMHFLQYTPCLKPFGSEDTEYSMSVSDYADYLNRAFSIYYNDTFKGYEISIRQFDNYCLLMAGEPAEQCGMNGYCCGQIVIEGDGSVYPCDFYCTDEWYIGNINESCIAELIESEKFIDFVSKADNPKEECISCRHRPLCRYEGCRRNREAYNYCEAYKKFFSENNYKLSNMLEMQ